MVVLLPKLQFPGWTIHYAFWTVAEPWRHNLHLTSTVFESRRKGRQTECLLQEIVSHFHPHRSFWQCPEQWNIIPSGSIILAQMSSRAWILGFLDTGMTKPRNGAAGNEDLLWCLEKNCTRLRVDKDLSPVTMEWSQTSRIPDVNNSPRSRYEISLELPWHSAIFATLW